MEDDKKLMDEHVLAIKSLMVEHQALKRAVINCEQRMNQYVLGIRKHYGLEGVEEVTVNADNGTIKEALTQ